MINPKLKKLPRYLDRYSTVIQAQKQQKLILQSIVHYLTLRAFTLILLCSNLKLSKQLKAH